jgi:hypothetical protein
MEESRDYTEKRKHERLNVNKVVVAILNSDEPVTVGSITDISLSGVKCTYDEFRLVSNDNPVHSIDLIADNHDLVDIPGKAVWDVKVERETFSTLTNVRQCGIQFGELTPKQIFLLKNFIDHCASLGTNATTSNTDITYS